MDGEVCHDVCIVKYILVIAYSDVHSINKHFMVTDLLNFCTLSFMIAISSSSSCLWSREEEGATLGGGFTLRVRKSFIRFLSLKVEVLTESGVLLHHPHLSLSESLSFLLLNSALSRLSWQRARRSSKRSICSIYR